MQFLKSKLFPVRACRADDLGLKRNELFQKLMSVNF